MVKRPKLTDEDLDMFAPTEKAEEEKDSAKAGQYRRKTYLLSDDLIERIEALANELQVGKSELVRYMIKTFLDEVENGEREIPTKPVRGKRIAPK